jgi:hypothetical protein
MNFWLSSFCLLVPSKSYSGPHCANNQHVLFECDFEDHLILPPLTEFSDVLPRSCIDSSKHLSWSVSGWSCAPILFSLYMNYVPTPPRLVYLALHADDTARQPTLHSYRNWLEHWLRDMRVTFKASKSTERLRDVSKTAASTVLGASICHTTEEFSSSNSASELYSVCACFKYQTRHSFLWAVFWFHTALQVSSRCDA